MFNFAEIEKVPKIANFEPKSKAIHLVFWQNFGRIKNV